MQLESRLDSPLELYLKRVGVSGVCKLTVHTVFVCISCEFTCDALVDLLVRARTRITKMILAKLILALQ